MKTLTKKEDYEVKKASKKNLRIAYALNLCTVSVSQIIDYNDINILEQEYDAILNNLNLEEMPNDEEFLKVLKQLLDTITFFRIQEKEKQFIERDYQQRMKDAIWNAVPNFGMVVAGGLNPVSIGISLASMVGIGYMNYRKEKAKAGRDKEKQNWELEKSAMEQFNGLRRELFDAAWHLSGRYHFDDRLRLTENQIKQYDEILMDDDLIRKYERLNSIRKYFKAYPPFWYQFGDTALSISEEYRDKNKEIFLKYREFAKEHLETFEKNYIPLMREDAIAASAYLEHVDLLDPISERAKIEENISKALELAGKQYDIQQLCAMEYLNYGDYVKAEPIFLNLVNSDYNKNMNATLLSRSYVGNFINGNLYKESDEENSTGVSYAIPYELLSKRVNSRYLLPFPSEDMPIEKLSATFVEEQRDIVTEKVKLVLTDFFNRYNIAYNQVIPTPKQNGKYSDEYFLDVNNERSNELMDLLNRKKDLIQFASLLSDSDFRLNWLDLLNDMMDQLSKFPYFNIEKNKDFTAKALKETSSKLGKLVEKLEGNTNEKLPIDKDDMKLLISKASFKDVTKDFVTGLSEDIKEYIDTFTDASSIFNFESELREWCKQIGIEEPEILFDNYEPSARSERKLWIEADVFGSEVQKKVEERTKQKNLKEDLSKIIEDYKDKISENPEKLKFITDVNSIDVYLSKNKSKTINNLDVIAIIDDFSWGNADLVLTTKGMFYKNRESAIAYDDVQLKNGYVQIGRDLYKPKFLKTDALHGMLEEIKKVI